MVDSSRGAKPESFGSVIRDAHLRIDYLAKICKALVLEAEPDQRRHLEDLVQAVTRHNVDPESNDAP